MIAAEGVLHTRLLAKYARAELVLDKALHVWRISSLRPLSALCQCAITFGLFKGLSQNAQVDTGVIVLTAYPA